MVAITAWQMHIRIDAKRQALDAPDAPQRETANGDGANQAEIETVIDVADDLTSQSAVERVAPAR